MRRVGLAALAVLAACGRLEFGTVGDAGGSGDAVDATGDAGPSCPAGVELCDDFEAAQLDASRWMSDPGVTLDTTVAHRGKQSVHFQTPALAASQQGYARLYESTTLPLGDPTFYVRAYLRLGGLPAGTNGVELIAAYQTSGGSQGDYVFAHAATLDIYDEFTSGFTSTTAAPPLETWLCVLWTVHRATGSTGSIMLAGDPEALALPSQQTDTSPPIAMLALGIGFSAPNVDVAQPVLDLWIDDVIVDKAPLTCAE